MKVEDLIKLLKEMPKNVEVMITDGEDEDGCITYRNVNDVKLLFFCNDVVTREGDDIIVIM